MAASAPTFRPNPDRIFNTMIAFQDTEALKAAIELDIFTAIADGANTAPLLAAKQEPPNAAFASCAISSRSGSF